MSPFLFFQKKEKIKMGESENQESDFIRVITALFKEDIEDAVKSVYKTRIGPTIKRTASDSLKDIIDRLFGNTPTTPSVPAGSVQSNQRTDYTKRYVAGGMPASTMQTLNSVTSQSNAGKSAVSNTNFNGLPHYVTVATSNDAQNIVDAMNDVIREDGEVSVNDFFDFAGQSNRIAGNSTATRYGWDNIDDHSITEMPDGQWMLAMPRYKYLGKEK